MIKPIESLLSSTERSEAFMDYVIGLLQNSQITPQKQALFAPFDIDEEQMNVVIVNTQPYMDGRVSSGLLFGITDKSSSYDTVPSFRNFTNNIASRYENDITYGAEFDKSFEYLKKQNVLMLNVVIAAPAYSYIQRDDIVCDVKSAAYLSRVTLMDEMFYYLNNIERPLEFIFLGENNILNYYKNLLNTKVHNVYTMVDPRDGPDQSDTFKEVNKSLIKRNEKPINFSNKSILDNF